LEPVCLFAGDNKVTTDNADSLRFWAHRKLAKGRFEAVHILHHNALKMVDWEIVYRTLRNVPKLFQLWASNQVMGIAGTMEWDKSVVWKCPSPSCTLA
jgi:hypothetical protein